MKYVKFYGSAGFCGTNYEEYEAFEDSVTEEEIQEISNDKGQNNGEDYEYLATQGYDEEDYDSLEDFEEAQQMAIESYWEDCEDGWVYVTEEEYYENI